MVINIVNRARMLFLAITLCLCFGGCNEVNPKDADSIVSGDSIMTMAIFSDVHIGKKNTGPEEKFTHALKQLSSVVPQLDAIAFGGDIVDRGTDAEYREFINILNANTDKSVKKISCMGNHEYFRDGVVRYGGESKSFIKECQNAYQEFIGGELDTVTVVNGVHIIALSARNSASDYAACEEFLISEVEKAALENPKMPIVIISHEGAGSFFEGGCSGYTQKTVKALEKYPQIIFFSGHTHLALQDMRMIQQSAYTKVQTSTLGADFWNYSIEEEHQPKNADSASQGLILEVLKDGTSKIIRYDFTNNQAIGQEWIVDSNNFIYDIKTNKKLANEPAFSSDSLLEVTYKEGDTVLNFPKAFVKDEVSDGIVYAYRIRITDQAGKIVFNTSMMSDYYMGVKAKDTYSFTVSKLTPGSYTASVVAVSVYDKRSVPLKLDFII